MYYGDPRKKKRSKMDFRIDLLQHLIVGLKVLQKEGNLLLKVSDQIGSQNLALRNDGLLFSKHSICAPKSFQPNQSGKALSDRFRFIGKLLFWDTF